MNPDVEIKNVTGIGIKLAGQLEKLGKSKVGQLSESDLETLPLEARLTIKYLNGEKYSRKEATIVISEWKDWFAKFCSFYLIAGSYRRGNTILKDLDFIIIPTKTLSYPADKVKIIKSGEKKVKLLYNSPGINRYIPIDILITNKKSLPASILYFTGSKNFNIQIRIKAREKGWKLNEYGVFNSSGKFIPVSSERALLKKIYGKYVKPEDRNN